MKKLLIGTSALVAAGLVAGAAHAADPIKLNIGGFAGSWVVYAEQDDAYLGATETNAVDVKSDAEVIFTGSTTLDNGLKVSFKTEMEAGGRDMGKVIDEYNVAVSGSFGTVIMGADDTALAAIAVTSPRVGGRLYGGVLSEGDNVMGFNVADAVVAGGASGGVNTAPNASFINTGGDSETISYVSPSFAGFTVGASYMPDVLGGRNSNVALIGGNTLDAYGVGAAYNGEFSGVGVKVAGGWLTADHVGFDEYNEYQFGANVSYAGFTFGGGLHFQERELGGLVDTSRDTFAWDLGASYKTGPYGVSLAYFDGRSEKASGLDIDKRQVWELNGEYSMGPGVALVGGLGYANYEANDFVAGVATSAENDGMFASTGITLSF